MTREYDALRVTVVKGGSNGQRKGGHMMTKQNRKY